MPHCRPGSFWLPMPLRHARWVLRGLRCHTGFRYIGTPAPGNPMFPARQKCSAFRLSVRSFLPFIGGWLGEADCVRILSQFHSLLRGSRELSCEPVKDKPIELEFRQCSLGHVHLTLTLLHETTSFWTAFSNDALFTAPFRALTY